jgi:integrase
VIVYLQKGGEARFMPMLLARWRGKPLTEITQREVDDVARELFPNAKPATLIRHVYGPVVCVLRAAKLSELPGSFVPIFRKPRVKREPVRYATDDYLRELLLQCPAGLQAAILLMTFTGLRTGEVLRLTEADFLVRPGWVNVIKTKTGKPRMIPLPEGWEYPKGGWGYRTSQGFSKGLKRAAKAAGLPYLSGHKVGRHAFAARLLAAGYDIQMVKEAGGWDTIKIVSETYGHLHQSHVHEAMRSVGKGLMRKKP